MKISIAPGTPASSLPAYNHKVKCKRHPTAKRHHGYGLHGGGIGPYTYCGICQAVVSKSLDPDAQPIPVNQEDK